MAAASSTEEDKKKKDKSTENKEEEDNIKGEKEDREEGKEEDKEEDKEEETSEKEKEDSSKTDEVVVEAAAEVPATTKGVESDEEGDAATPAGGKRRFFPRVKHLLTREWEYFLTGVLDAMEEAAAPTAAAASHKLSNPWYKAFDLVYQGVASDCSMPTGKNRYHKFKDKIVELWLAMEQHATDDHPQRARALDQLEEYRKSCLHANKKEATASKTSAGGMPLPLQKGGAGEKSVASKRSYTATLTSARWKHLNESAALENLPEPLLSLVHLRGLTAEMGGDKTDVESKYEKALENYLKEDVEQDKDALFTKSQSLAALYRQTLSNKESKEISETYQRILQEYLVLMDPNTATV